MFDIKFKDHSGWKALSLIALYMTIYPVLGAFVFSGLILTLHRVIGYF